MSCSKATVLVLFALIGTFWLKGASVRAAPFLDDFDFSRWNQNLSEHLDSILSFDEPEATRKGPINIFGSRVHQSNNVYGADFGKGAVFGSIDVQIGNSYSGDPDATNVYGPTVIQENNTYQGINENAVYGAVVLRANNSYDHNRGSNVIYDPIVIQSYNVYHKNIKNDSVLGANVKPSGHNDSPSHNITI